VKVAPRARIGRGVGTFDRRLWLDTDEQRATLRFGARDFEDNHDEGDIGDPS
jgi:hypothetical protein